ncbi:MAG: hypothetical protein HYR91_03270 [Flavobacteriia bacterium]|nr:hypothetical protein [Flavobacteriia bacterium]
MLRHKIVFYLLFSWFSLSGQVEKNAPVQNTNINYNSVEEIQLDSNFRKEESDKKTEEKVIKSYSKKKNEPATTQDTGVNVQKKSIEFNVSKTQSSIQRTQKTPTDANQQSMNEVVQYLEENAPESFEYNFYKYVSGNYNLALNQYLFKAQEIQPNNPEVLSQLVAYYWLSEDKSNTLVNLNKLIANNKLSSESIVYAKDLLLSVPENGVLITHGFDDSYASMYLQLNENLRSDVKIINLDFLQSEKYKNDLTKLGFTLPAQKNIDVTYLTEFCKNNEFKKIAISLTVPKEYFQTIQTNLFVVGLIFEFHSIPENNFYKNEFIWNSVLEKKLISSPSSEKAKQLSSNYLLMLFQLRDVYASKNEKKKVVEIDAIIDKIAVQCKKYEQVQKIKKKY